MRQRKYDRALSICCQLYENTKLLVEQLYWQRQITRIKDLVLYHSLSPSTVKIWFDDFWPGFNYYENEIVNLFRQCCNYLGLRLDVSNKQPNIVVSSCFSSNYDSSKLHHQATKFLYLGENVRPCYEHVDYSLCFDFDNYSGRNLYLPLWFLRLDNYASKNSGYEPINLSSLINTQYCYDSRPENKVIYIGNNMTPLRKSMIQLLENNNFTVDIYGSQSRPVESKLEKMKDYKYSLCFENSYHPGYVTEKVFDAFAGGTIPLYWGSEFKPPLNQSATITFSCNSLEDQIEMMIKSPLSKSVDILDADYFNIFQNKIRYFLTKLMYDLFS